MSVITHNPTPLHIWHVGQPLTLFVFGPYRANGNSGMEWDVEIHRTHVQDNGGNTHVTTVTLHRDTHIIADMWDHLTDAIQEV